MTPRMPSGERSMAVLRGREDHVTLVKREIITDVSEHASSLIATTEHRRFYSTIYFCCCCLRQRLLFFLLPIKT